MIYPGILDALRPAGGGSDGGPAEPGPDEIPPGEPIPEVGASILRLYASPIVRHTPAAGIRPMGAAYLIRHAIAEVRQRDTTVAYVVRHQAAQTTLHGFRFSYVTPLEEYS